jgi:hypothetical protein
MMSVRKVLLAVFCFAAAAGPAVAGQAVATDRLQSVGKLIENSSAAKKIDASGNAEAQKVRQQARDLYQQAVAASKAGNEAEEKRLLGEASRTMFQAVRLVEIPKSLVDKHQRDYQDRLASVTALLEAHDRIKQEKGAVADDQGELHRIVEAKLAEAEALKAQQKYVEGRAVLDQAYAAAKVAIEQLRGGDTLVRSLNFASKEEEYHYELDRNDTHRMLVEVLLAEKMQNSQGVKKMVDKFMGKAADIRKTAEQQAASGEFEAAVRSLEDSTKEIVRAIRSAGIYIPG